MVSVADDEGPLGRTCPEHDEIAIEYKFGFDPDAWQLWRFRCGCSDRA